jgi:hypothetical protein
MAWSWTSERVLALAPDASSAKAGQGLASLRKWVSAGRAEDVLWGLCQGSGSKPYQVRIDPSEPAYKCSCPSRKFPCKHALGLFLIAAGDLNGIKQADSPDWVKEWLESRSKRAEQKAKKQEAATAEPVDPEAAAKRVAERAKKMSAGMEELGRWLGDLARQGLATAPTQPYSFWESRAKRLTDAQAPGAARLVGEMGGIASGGEGWQGRLVNRLGRLYLLTEAYGRLESLPQPTRADVISLAGVPMRQEEVLAGPGVRDVWDVLGQRVEVEDRLRSRRTWLRGGTTGRMSLVLAFAYGAAPLDMSLVAGTCVDAELAYFPGTGLRALVKQRFGEPAACAKVEGFGGIGEYLGAISEHLASNPWTERHPAALAAVAPVHERGQWSVVDGGGYELPIHPRFARSWELLAVSGGRPVGLFGEWDGEALWPMSATVDGEFVAFASDETSVETAAASDEDF